MAQLSTEGWHIGIVWECSVRAGLMSSEKFTQIKEGKILWEISAPLPADEELKIQIHPGILRDFEERRLHWAQYNNPLEPLFKRIYSGFLKVNAQEKGIESYSYVVGLIVGHFQNSSNIKD